MNTNLETLSYHQNKLSPITTCAFQKLPLPPSSLHLHYSLLYWTRLCIIYLRARLSTPYSFLVSFARSFLCSSFLSHKTNSFVRYPSIIFCSILIWLFHTHVAPLSQRSFLFTDLLFMCIFLFRNNISTDSLSLFVFIATCDALLASSSSFTPITFRTPACSLYLHHHVPIFTFFTHFTTTLNSFHWPHQFSCVIHFALPASSSTFSVFSPPALSCYFHWLHWHYE